MIEKLPPTMTGTPSEIDAMLAVKIQELIDTVNGLTERQRPCTHPQDTVCKYCPIGLTEKDVVQASSHCPDGREHVYITGSTDCLHCKNTQGTGCQHESDGMQYLSYPVQYKCKKCGVFYQEGPVIKVNL